MENRESTHFKKCLFGSYCIQGSESVLIMHSWIFRALQTILSNTNMTCIIGSSEKSFELKNPLLCCLWLHLWGDGSQGAQRDPRSPGLGPRDWLHPDSAPGHLVQTQCASLLLPSSQKTIGYLSGIEEFSRKWWFIFKRNQSFLFLFVAFYFYFLMLFCFF